MLYDFYDAQRIVAGTKRRIRYNNNDWLSFHRWSGVESVSLTSHEDYTSISDDYWWPTKEQAKKKVWEVEPVEKIERWKVKVDYLKWVNCEDIVTESTLELPTGLIKGMPDWFEKL